MAEAKERDWEQRANWKSIGPKARAPIQAQIPKDPATVFAQSLKSMAQQQNTGDD
jgi:hypothetical protein